MQQLYTGLQMKKEWENYVEETKPVDYELNSKHQTPEQQPSNIPTVRSLLPALRTTFSLIIPKTGKCKYRSNIYQGKKSHLFSNA